MLLEASGGGELLKLPTADPAHRASLLRFEGTLQADGRLSGRLRGDMTGQDAVAWEWLRRLNPGEEFRARLLDWLASGGTRATVDSTTYAFDAAQARGTLSALLDWPTAGKVTSGRLLVFRPCAAHAYEIRELPDSARRSPVLVPCVSEVDTFSVRLPAGYAPEDLPAPVALDAGFGSLETRWWMDAGVLRVRFALASRRTLLPPARYADVRGFFAQANRARATPVVLAMN